MSAADKRKKNLNTSNTTDASVSAFTSRKALKPADEKRLGVLAGYVNYPVLDPSRFVADIGDDLSIIAPLSRSSNNACMCTLGSRCLNVRQRMILHDEFYASLVTLPPHSDKTTPTASLNNFVRRRWLHHLDRTDATDTKARLRVGVWHFHPQAIVLAKQLTTTFSRITFDSKTAASMKPLLTSSERISLPMSGSSLGRYINAPIMSINNMLAECDRLDVTRQQLGDLFAFGASGLNMASMRSAPDEDMLLKDLAIENLESTVQAMGEQDRRSDDLARRVKELEKELSGYRHAGVGGNGLTRANPRLHLRQSAVHEVRTRQRPSHLPAPLHLRGRLFPSHRRDLPHGRRSARTLGSHGRRVGLGTRQRQSVVTSPALKKLK